jgi:hypothetical protein
VCCGQVLMAIGEEGRHGAICKRCEIPYDGLDDASNLKRLRPDAPRVETTCEHPVYEGYDLAWYKVACNLIV